MQTLDFKQFLQKKNWHHFYFLNFYGNSRQSDWSVKKLTECLYDRIELSIRLYLKMLDIFHYLHIFRRRDDKTRSMSGNSLWPERGDKVVPPG